MSPSPARQTAPHRLLGLPGLLVAGFLAALGSIVVAGPPAPDATREPGAGQEKTTYRPGLAVPDTMAPFLEHVEPGTDAFPLEGQARELEARLRDVSDAFRGGAARLSGVTRTLLDPGFRGGRLLPAQERGAEPVAARGHESEGSARAIRRSMRAPSPPSSSG